MSKTDALNKWLGNPELAEKLSKRVADVEQEIVDNDIVVRTDAEVEESEELEETQETEAVEESEEVVEEVLEIELSEENINELAETVANILEARMARTFETLTTRIAELEKSLEVKEDKPKAQQVRFRTPPKEELSEVDEPQTRTQVFNSAKEDIKDIRKARLAKLQEKVSK